jgi:hypothetical protein
MPETNSEIRGRYERQLGHAHHALYRAAEIADGANWEGERDDLEVLQTEVGRLIYDSVTGRRVRRLHRQFGHPD